MRTPRISRHLFLLTTTLCCLLLAPRPCAGHSGADASAAPAPRTRSAGGVREVIPNKYRERYQGWKREFLSTEVGRREWEKYELDGRFALTITVSNDDPQGAGTGHYKWDESGRLVAATITLGSRINEGYPNPIYYPVMSSLLPLTGSYGSGGSVLAAAKIAHEFGHIKQAMSLDGGLYRLQNQLMPAYNEILLGNGRNVHDPRLVELAGRMGGTPVSIWENREYWGEVSAMRFLRERITDEDEQRALCMRVRRTVELYAKDYVERFDEVTQ